MIVTLTSVVLNDYRYVKDPDEIVDSDWLHMDNVDPITLVLNVPPEWVGMPAGLKNGWTPRTFMKPVA